MKIYSEAYNSYMNKASSIMGRLLYEDDDVDGESGENETSVNISLVDLKPETQIVLLSLLKKIHNAPEQDEISDNKIRKQLLKLDFDVITIDDLKGLVGANPITQDNTHEIGQGEQLKLFLNDLIEDTQNKIIEILNSDEDTKKHKNIRHDIIEKMKDIPLKIIDCSNINVTV